MLYVYQTADGRPITLAMVERRLEQLLAHRPGSWCGRCEPAAKARADDVFRIAVGWQRSVAATR